MGTAAQLSRKRFCCQDSSGVENHSGLRWGSRFVLDPGCMARFPSGFGWLPGYGQGKTHSQSITCELPGDSPAPRGFNLSCEFTLMLLGHPEFSSGLFK